MSLATYIKDPDAVLDYHLNWKKELDSDDTINGLTTFVPTGITKNSDSYTDTRSSIWLSGGSAGGTYDIIFRITTSGGRTDDRTITIRVEER